MDKTEKYIYHRGDIVYVNDLPATGGHELCGNRPAVIISSNHLNRYFKTITERLRRKGR